MCRNWSLDVHVVRGQGDYKKSNIYIYIYIYEHAYNLLYILMFSQMCQL